MKPHNTLEPLDLSHTDELYQLIIANKDYLREWLAWIDGVNTVEDTQDFIESCMKEAHSRGTPTFIMLLDGEICGVIGYNHISHLNRTGTIGYWLAEKFTGKGVMTRAVDAVLRLGFFDFKLTKIEIRCAEGNAKSRAIPERLGFKFEATLRQCEWLYTRYVDHTVYTLLDTEYKPL